MKSCGFKQGNIYSTYKTELLPLHWRLRGHWLLANIVRATSEGLNTRAGVDIAACATSPVADSADHGTATGVLIDCDTVSSSNKNLKDKRMSVNEIL